MPHRPPFEFGQNLTAVPQPITIRSYQTDDLQACLDLFDSNVPDYFAPEERPDFLACLNRMHTEQRPYLVVTRGESIIAGGGVVIHADQRQARLAWGMVHRFHQGQGLGTRLLKARLALVQAATGVETLGLETSQHTFRFYQRFGFDVETITPNGLAPGLDRYAMTIPCNNAPAVGANRPD